MSKPSRFRHWRASHPVGTTASRAAHRSPAKGVLVWIAQYLLAPAIVGLIAFASGYQLEESKRFSASQQFLYEQKMRVWTSSAKHFSAYIANWNRLRGIAGLEAKTGSLTRDEKTRKNQYVRDRDIAWEGLESTLWEASLLFGPSARQAIDEYFAFEATQGNLRLSELAPAATWQMHRDRIMSQLRLEATPR